MVPGLVSFSYPAPRWLAAAALSDNGIPAVCLERPYLWRRNGKRQLQAALSLADTFLKYFGMSLSDCMQADLDTEDESEKEDGQNFAGEASLDPIGPVTSNPGWCEQHQVFGCMFRHGNQDSI